MTSVLRSSLTSHELQPPDGGTTFMVPFNAAFVPSLDLAGGRIVVAPLEPMPGSPGGSSE